MDIIQWVYNSSELIKTNMLNYGVINKNKLPILPTLVRTNVTYNTSPLMDQ